MRPKGMSIPHTQESKRKISKAMTTHGMSFTAEYRSWKSMKDRCYLPKMRAFKNYGARGIRVCKRWLNSFENFFADMGYKPTKYHTLERKNNNGNYTPSNCRWATKVEQQANRRNTVFITIEGITKSASEWKRIYGIQKRTYWVRLQNGLSPAQAITLPLFKSRSEINKAKEAIQKHSV